MIRLVTRFVLVGVVSLVARSASAEQSYWGVAGSIVPTWHATDTVKILFNADNTDIKGSDFRIGFVRGATERGDWGVSFVRRTVTSGGIVNRGEDGLYVIGDNVTMTGVSIEKFGVITTIKKRVQIGILGGGGVASVKGTARLDGATLVEANHALLPLEVESKLQPLARLEVGGAVIVAPGFKIRVTGGFDYPGFSRISVGGVYFFER